MRLLITILTFAALLALIAPRAALAQNNDCAHHDSPTIESLRMCAEHHIDNAGVVKSLLVKLDAAQKALDRGQPLVAVNNLSAFVQAVEAQSGKHIEASHAEHLIMHAEHVIEALNP